MIVKGDWVWKSPLRCRLGKGLSVLTSAWSKGWVDPDHVADILYILYAIQFPAILITRSCMIHAMKCIIHVRI